MAEYKVPQDVEAEDKLLGPFSFRQFVYLMIVVGLFGLGFLLFKIFPFLAFLVVPPILLFGALALPIHKDQPMETYLTALISFYTRPNTRVWRPGEPDSIVEISAPKNTEEVPLKTIGDEETSRRLSFLANIVDTEGYAVKGRTNFGVKDEIYAEAETAEDMLDIDNSSSISRNLALEKTERHNDLISEMRSTIDASNLLNPQAAFVDPLAPELIKNNPTVVKPDLPYTPQLLSKSGKVIPAFDPLKPISSSKDGKTVPEPAAPAQTLATPQTQTTLPPESAKPTPSATNTPPVNQAMLDLANNKDFSIQTIAKEANRINHKKDSNDEVFIALH